MAENYEKDLIEKLRGKRLRSEDWRRECKGKAGSKSVFYHTRKKLVEAKRVESWQEKKAVYNWLPEDEREGKIELPLGYKQKMMEKKYLPLQIPHTAKIKETVIKPWIDEIDKILVYLPYGIIDQRSIPVRGFTDLRNNIMLLPLPFRFHTEDALLFSDLKKHLIKGLNPLTELGAFKSELKKFEEKRYNVFTTVQNKIREATKETFVIVNPNLVYYAMECLFLGATTYTIEAIMDEFINLAKELSCEWIVDKIPSMLRSSAQIVSLWLPPERRVGIINSAGCLTKPEKAFVVEINKGRCLLHPSFTITPFTEALEEVYRATPGQEIFTELENFWRPTKELLEPLSERQNLQPTIQFFGTIPAGSLKDIDISTEEIADTLIGLFKGLKVMLSEDILELIVMESNLNRRLFGMKDILKEYYKMEVFHGTCEYLL